MTNETTPPELPHDSPVVDSNASTHTEVPAEVPAPPPSFDDMGLDADVRQALNTMGYELPMPVQTAVFTPAMAGRDIMVQSQTGTGKTAAFGIPIAQKLDVTVDNVQALALAPTRELALQVARELEKICAVKKLGVVPIYGGAPIRPQIEALQSGAHVVAGTPGRVLDHLKRGTLDPSAIRMLVLDECDEMLSMGFQEEIDAIIDKLPQKDQRQTLLFSATIPNDIQRIARQHMTEPEELAMAHGSVQVDEIDHFYYVVNGVARTRDLLTVLQTERPESAIVFCNTRDDTNVVAKFLSQHGYSAEAISSDLSQRDRERVMKLARDGNLQFLVATDVAARGIDINDLSHVINYSFPESPEVYVHRTGRTGRAGARGVAISLIGPREIGAFYYLKLIYKITPVERTLPSAGQLAVEREGEMYERVVNLVDDTPSAEYRALARRLWQSSEGERVVAALIQRALHTGDTGSRSAQRDARRRQNDDRDRKGDRDKDRTRERTRRDRGKDRERTRERGRDNDRDRERTRERDDENGRRRRRRRRDENGSENRERSRRRREDKSDKPTTPAPAATADDKLTAANPAAEASPSKAAETPRSDQSAPGEDQEFWETWADEKTQEAQTRKQGSSRASGTTRLYVNIGKREDVTADDVRTFLSEGLEESEKIGSIALRNTHCYVRVPDTLADRIIEASAGKSFKDRQIVVERARR